MALFNKNKKEEKKKLAKPVKVSEETVEQATEKVSSPAVSVSSMHTGILKGFYVSEKGTRAFVYNQYTFRVSNNANKPEIKKQVEKIYNVKVKDIKTLNTPGKTRNIGRYEGFKPGYKKAIVVLKEGYSIDQAKA